MRHRVPPHKLADLLLRTRPDIWTGFAPSNDSNYHNAVERLRLLNLHLSLAVNLDYTARASPSRYDLHVTLRYMQPGGTLDRRPAWSCIHQKPAWSCILHMSVSHIQNATNLSQWHLGNVQVSLSCSQARLD